MQRGAPFGVAAFIGRCRERAKVAELLGETRMVTLTGSGGSGKTRLAMEVTGDVAARFADGVCWVDLQAVSEPARVAPAVAEAMDVGRQPGQTLADTIVEQLQGQHLLVVLDNCEHLVQACSELVGKLLATCPQIHLLATSRVPLAVAGEASFDVAPLPVPAPDACSISMVASAEAARLFEVRARQVNSEFRIDDGNAGAVAEICRHLDGVPLAIELAAARVRVLTPSQIAAGLSDRFGLLTRGARGAPARQQTLEASLDWSYDLLDDVQRLALARLSVFAGSFELDAAEAVMAGRGIDQRDGLDLVAGLTEQSLLEVVERDGSARYRLLESVRVYARQRLSELDDPDRVRECHLDFHVGLAGRAKAGLAGGRPEAWVARLTADMDDLRAAMDWAVDSGDLPALVGLTEPIHRFWFDRAGFTDVYRRLHDAAICPEANDRERARGLTTASLLALAGGGPKDAYRSSGLAVDAARSANLDGSLVMALSVRAQAGSVTGLSTIEQVGADVAEAIEKADKCGDPPTQVHALVMAGWTLLHSGTIDAARRPLERAIEVCETSGFPFHLPAAHAILGLWPVFSGQLTRTRHHARRGWELANQVGRPAYGAVGMTGLAACDILQGDHKGAQDHISKAQAVLRAPSQEGNLYRDEFLRPWFALSAYLSGDVEGARATAAMVVRIARGWGNRWNEALGEWLLGLIALGQGDKDDAQAHLQASHALSTDPVLPFPQGRSLLGLAALAHHDERLGEAWELAQDGLAVLDDYGDRVGSAAALEQIAGLAADLGEPQRALRLLGASQRFHTESGIVRFPFQADCFGRACYAAQTAVGLTDDSVCWDAGKELSLVDAVSYARRGRGERRRPDVGWESLTPVECEIARLVADGHANAEIGRRLFISVNTVKKHLSHVYEKVAVDGRVDLAGQVVRRGL